MSNTPRTEMDELREMRALERKHQAETERFFENKVTGETVALTPEQTKASDRRNLWIALSIGAFVVLVFLITMTKVQEGIVAGAS